MKDLAIEVIESNSPPIRPKYAHSLLYQLSGAPGPSHDQKYYELRANALVMLQCIEI